MNKKGKILVWGCGKRCTCYMEKGLLNLNYIYGFIDSNLKFDQWNGKRVYRPEEAAKLIEENNGIEYIIVTTEKESVCKEILQTAFDSGIPEEKLIFIHNMRREVKTTQIHSQNTERIRKLFPELLLQIETEETVVKRTRAIVGCGFDLIDQNILLGTSHFNNEAYSDEYVRYRTFEFVANEIQKNGIKGAVAEIGVFRGTFASLINAKFPDRKLYLFDSFESFNQSEYKEEVLQGNCEESFIDFFKNTSVEIVMQNMMYPDNCIIRKGFFPESMREDDKEVQFAFVSMDVDLEESTYQCLKNMYPLVTEGGYIFLHDYNNRFLGGVKKAIQRYENELGKNLKKVPLCDEGGTLIILK